MQVIPLVLIEFKFSFFQETLATFENSFLLFATNDN